MQAASVGASPRKKPLIDEPPAIGGVGVPKDGDESDAEARKVPEMVGKASTSGIASLVHSQGGGSSSRRRGAGPAEKEHKRMKRLLRNRVSAQQARERKKAYLSDLEVKTKELEQRNAELEERLSTLQRENFMLRQIVKNTAIKNNGGTSAGASRIES